ncbi:hypothetical protein AF333_10855 [Aneurinibacillus migulanus]|uniref:Uncharacterized protein n=1 Tax=Aneurinibacillus migulanus TaxID=47500 RepID=A0A0M0H2H3_ANEMI|nr:hypothetical protein AF333_10855 [Aneurinibacillus migulanus]
MQKKLVIMKHYLLPYVNNLNCNNMNKIYFLDFDKIPLTSTKYMCYLFIVVLQNKGINNR